MITKMSMTEKKMMVMFTLRLVLPACCKTIFSGFRSLWINLDNQKIDTVI